MAKSELFKSKPLAWLITVLGAFPVDRAAAAGAKFIVSPGFNPKVVAHCVEKGIPVVPGCSSPSDIEAALEFGLDTVKVFPAEQIGGLDFIKAVAAPYTSMRFMPTGGVNAENIGKYLAFEKIAACGGSWMVAAPLVKAGNFDEITRLCKEAVRAALGFELIHIGVNAAGAADAAEIADLFAAAFGFARGDGNSSIFAGPAIEVMKSPYLGKNGHIAIRTNSVGRARKYLEARGFAFDESTAKFDEKGNPSTVYLQKEFGGFAVHLLQKK